MLGTSVAVRSSLVMLQLRCNQKIQILMAGSLGMLVQIKGCGSVLLGMLLGFFLNFLIHF